MFRAPASDGLGSALRRVVGPSDKAVGPFDARDNNRETPTKPGYFVTSPQPVTGGNRMKSFTSAARHQRSESVPMLG
jgi:hypothetical protein